MFVLVYESKARKRLQFFQKKLCIISNYYSIKKKTSVVKICLFIELN